MESIQALEEFKSLKVLIIGDVMIDEYMWGKVDRISPEAPIPVVAIERREERLGGAANVALNIKSLGAEPILCSVIGNDLKAELFKNLCLSSKIQTIGIIESHHRLTTTKTRIIGHSQHLLRVDDEIDKPLNIEEEDLFTQRIFQIFDTVKINAVLFEDYDKGCLTPKIIEKVVSEASKRKIPVTVDPKHRNFMNYKNIDLFKPNLKELAIGLKTDINKSKLLEQLPMLCHTLMQQQGHKAIMVTLSELGMFIMNQQESYHIHTQVRDLADVSGAGDTVIATATLCLALGMSLYDIANISNIAAGIVCEKVGVVPITKEELKVKLS
jgi:rfaE bifunctional protein kinase chain/domain